MSVNAIGSNPIVGALVSNPRENEAAESVPEKNERDEAPQPLSALKPGVGSKVDIRI